MKPALAGTVCRNSVPMAAVAMNPSMNQGNATLRLPPTSVTSLWRFIPPDGHDDRDEHEHEHAGKLHDVRHGGRIDLTGGNPDG